MGGTGCGANAWGGDDGTGWALEGSVVELLNSDTVTCASGGTVPNCNVSSNLAEEHSALCFFGTDIFTSQQTGKITPRPKAGC